MSPQTIVDHIDPQGINLKEGYVVELLKPIHAHNTTKNKSSKACKQKSQTQRFYVAPQLDKWVHARLTSVYTISRMKKNFNGRG